MTAHCFRLRRALLPAACLPPACPPLPARYCPARDKARYGGVFHFDSYWDALVSLFIVFVGNNWRVVVWLPHLRKQFSVSRATRGGWW